MKGDVKNILLPPRDREHFLVLGIQPLFVLCTPPILQAFPIYTQPTLDTLRGERAARI
jgi:hypothetical protein